MKPSTVVFLLLVGLACGQAFSGDDVAAAALRLKSPELAVRVAAAKALQEKAPDCKAAIPQLVEALADEYWDVRTVAAAALAKTGKDAVPALVGALGGTNYFSKFGGIRVLRRVASTAREDVRDAAPALVAMLRDDAQDVRLEAANALAETGVPPGLATNVVAALTDANASVREAVGPALASVAAEAAPHVVRLLEHPSAEVRVSAAGALVHIGPAARDAVPRLVAQLEGEWKQAVREYGKMDPGIRDSRYRRARSESTAGAALAAMGSAAVPPLIPLLGRDDPMTQEWVCTILGRMGAGAEGAVPALTEMARASTNTGVRLQAAIALGAVGAAAEPAVAALSPGLRDSQEIIRRYFAQTVGKIGGTGIAALVEALKDARPEVRLAAAQGLKAAGKRAESARSVLEVASKDENESVRTAATEAMEALDE